METYWKRFWKQVWTDLKSWVRAELTGVVLAVVAVALQWWFWPLETDWRQALLAVGAFAFLILFFFGRALIRAPVKLDEKLRGDWHNERERMKAAQAKQVDALQDRIGESEKQVEILRRRPYDDHIAEEAANLLRAFPPKALTILEFLLKREHVKREQVIVPGVDQSTLNGALEIGRKSGLIVLEERQRGGIFDRFVSIPQVYREPLKDLLHPYPKPLTGGHNQ